MRENSRNKFNESKPSRQGGLSFITLGLVVLLAISSAVYFINFRKPEYIRKQEFFQKNVVQILNKMLGRHNYIVNVSIQYSETQRQVNTVQYTPRDITERIQNASRENKKEDTDESLQTEGQSNKSLEGKDSLTNKTYRYDQQGNKTVTTADPQEQVQTVKSSTGIEKLPGLVPRSSKGYALELPGFPRVNPSYIEGKVKQTVPVGTTRNDNNGQPVVTMPQHDTSEKADTTTEGAKNQQTNKTKKQNSFGTERKEDQTIVKQILNENKETIIIPDSKIEKLFISIVLNKDQLSELNLSKEDVANVVQSVVGYAPERGDQFFIITYPFKGFAYTLRKNVTEITDLFKAYKWFFVIVIGLPLLIYLGVTTLRIVTKYRAENARKLEFHRLQEEKKKFEQTKSTIDRQVEEIVSLAKAKPAEFAKALIDWIEKSGNNS